MASVGTKRKLTAILAADVVGYSRLMSVADETTVQQLNGMREIITPLVEGHEGRLFGEAGDSLMAEFPSAVEALRCAMEIQEEIALRNLDAPPERAMQFRIGINIGEVIVEGEKLYGDGVNIAARLQEIADPGGVVMSAAAHDQVRNKISVEVEPLGPRNLKNIPDAVPVFRIRLPGQPPATPIATAVRSRFGWRRRAIMAATGVAIAIAGIVGWDLWAGPTWQFKVFKAEAAQPVPAQPSIVVMPFLNASENEAQEYFCLGVAEDILTALTKVKGLFVVGRDSAMSFKGKNAPARQVGRELGVRYVLQGSVRRADNRVRISTYLVDAATEQTVWAARYDRELNDIFAVQDDIAGRVTQALSVSFRPGLSERPIQVAQNFAAYDKFLKARGMVFGPGKEDLIQARRLFTEVTELDPDFAGGYAGISHTHSVAVRHGQSGSPRDDVAAALKFAKLALSKDNQNGFALSAMASAELMAGHQDAAVKNAEEAYQLRPGDAIVNAFLGFIYAFDGRAKEGLQYIDQAIDLERVTRYQAQDQFARLFIAYTAGAEAQKADKAEAAKLFSIAYKSYETFLSMTPSSGIPCINNCLAYASSSARALAKLAGTAVEREAWLSKGEEISRTLNELNPNFPRQFQSWTRLIKDKDVAGEITDDVTQALEAVKNAAPRP